VPDWHPGLSGEDPRHFARWTEVYPVDLIAVLPTQKPIDVAVRGVALAARTGINACEEVDFNLRPDAPRPSATTRVGYEELRGPET
jgi:hypothetical protein